MSAESYSNKNEMNLGFGESLPRWPCVEWKWEWGTKLENMDPRHRDSKLPAKPWLLFSKDWFTAVTAEQIQSCLQAAILEGNTNTHTHTHTHTRTCTHTHTHTRTKKSLVQTIKRITRSFCVFSFILFLEQFYDIGIPQVRKKLWPEQIRQHSQSCS
jgi:hypothetical protein